MDEVKVLYCFDSRFWRMAAVSMESLLSTAKYTTRIKVYCMVAPHTKGRKQIEKIIKSHKAGAGLVWREVKKRENPLQNYEYSRWSPVIFYRCIAHRFFPDVDKILYMDSDTLICRDIAELYNTDVSEYAFGAIRDMAAINDKFHPQGQLIKQFSEKYMNGAPYVNSGVLLLNLKKMAEYEHLLFETKVPLFYPDQDLLNAAFVGKMKILPLKYNLAPWIPISKIFTPEEAEEVMSGGHVILHCYSIKPYDYERAPDFLYELFSKHATAIGMDPKMFLEHDNKYARKKIKDTFVKHVRIQQNNILFFGMKIPL